MSDRPPNFVPPDPPSDVPLVHPGYEPDPDPAPAPTLAEDVEVGDGEIVETDEVEEIRNERKRR